MGNIILITGSQGFLGTHLVSALKRYGMRVVTLDYGPEVVGHGDCWFADLTRLDHVNQLVRTMPRPEVVIHLAGYINIVLKQNNYDASSAPLPGEEDIAQLYAVNVGATAHMVQYCLTVGVSRMIFASSQAVYGMPSGILTEQSECKPLEHYASSKLCAENLLQVAALQGLQVTIARFPGLYSERRKSGIVHAFCASALHKKHITVSCDYPLPIDVIYIDDVVNAMVIMLSTKQLPLRLNISTGKPCSLDILADTIAATVPDCGVTPAAIRQPIVCMDASLAYKTLGWSAQPLEYRLEKILESIRHAKSESISHSC